MKTKEGDYPPFEKSHCRWFIQAYEDLKQKSEENGVPEKVRQQILSGLHGILGEFLVAQRFLEAGYRPRSMGGEKADVKLENGDLIEVKYVKPSTNWWDKAVKLRTKKGDRKFDRVILVCQRKDDKGHDYYEFTFDEIDRIFPKCDWAYKYDKNCRLIRIFRDKEYYEEFKTEKALRERRYKKQVWDALREEGYQKFMENLEAFKWKL